MSVARMMELHRETVITILLLYSRRIKKKEKKRGFGGIKMLEMSPASHFLFLGMQKFQLILHALNSFDTVLMMAPFPPPQVQLLLSVAVPLTTASAQAAVINLVGGATAAKNNPIFFH